MKIDTKNLFDIKNYRFIINNKNEEVTAIDNNNNICYRFIDGNWFSLARKDDGRIYKYKDSNGVLIDISKDRIHIKYDVFETDLNLNNKSQIKINNCLYSIKKFIICNTYISITNYDDIEFMIDLGSQTVSIIDKIDEFY